MKMGARFGISGQVNVPRRLAGPCRAVACGIMVFVSRVKVSMMRLRYKAGNKDMVTLQSGSNL